MAWFSQLSDFIFINYSTQSNKMQINENTKDVKAQGARREYNLQSA